MSQDELVGLGVSGAVVDAVCFPEPPGLTRDLAIDTVQ